MIINAETLTGIYTGFSAVFNQAFQDTKTWHERVAMVVPSSTRVIDYKFLLDFPMMQEWLGDRQIKSLAAKTFLVESKDWEATIEVDRNDIEDDQIGLFNPLMAGLGQEAKKHPDQLIAQILKNGETGKCYDGEPFFSANHPVGITLAANTDTGSSTAWYLLDVSRPVKPFIFQLRRPMELQRLDQPEDENVFMRKKFRYGVDYRGVAAYGLWQLAFCSKQELNPTYYATVRNAMMNFKNAEGRPLGIRPNLLVVPPSLEAQAREILQAQYVPSPSGSKTNVWQGSADLLVVPELA
jgi:phage major head subunit gpT-like protein